MKPIEYSLKGQTVLLQMGDVYCCKGQYDGRFCRGWIAVDSEGATVMGDDTITKGRGACWGVDRVEFPAFETRRQLVETIDGINESFYRRSNLTQ